MSRKRNRSRAITAQDSPHSVKSHASGTMESASSRNYRTQKRTTLRYNYRIKGPVFPVVIKRMEDED